MIDTIFRVAAILVMIGIMFGAGKISWWLAAAWFPSADVVSLSVQPFNISHGDKAEQEEGKHLAARFVKQIQRIQLILSADLSNIGNTDQVRIESVVPRSLNLSPDVPVKIDVEFKAFDVDVVGMFEKVHNFFNLSDQLQVSVWSNETTGLFAALKSENEQRRLIGPWWLDKLENAQVAVDNFAHIYALDLYKTRVHGLDQLDAASFASFVDGVEGYQEFVKAHYANPRAYYEATLKHVGDTFQKIVDAEKGSALVFSYLGSVRSLQNQADEAINAYARAGALNPDDKFAARALVRLRGAEVLQSVAVAGPEAGPVLAALQAQPLAGYDAKALPPVRRDISIAVIGTGISPDLAKVLGSRLVYSSSTLQGDADTLDYLDHGTAVTAVVAALAPSAKIISIKGFSRFSNADSAAVPEAIRRATEQKADVILLPFVTASPVKAIADAVKEAIKAGALVVGAAGNESQSEPSFPARLPEVLAVGALDASNTKVAIYSNHGPDVLFAPGTDILTMAANGTQVRRSGTSFSAAIASAIGAVAWAAKPDQSAEQIRRLLLDTSTDIGPVANVSPSYELRRIDAIAASMRLSRLPN